MPEGFLVKLHITDLAIVGEAGQCSQDKLTVTDSQQSLGKTRRIISVHITLSGLIFMFIHIHFEYSFSEIISQGDSVAVQWRATQSLHRC